MERRSVSWMGRLLGLGLWLGSTAWALAAERWPSLPSLVDAVRLDPKDGVAAERLGSALMHRDWMLPVPATGSEAWRESATVRKEATGALVSPDGTRRVEWNGDMLKLVLAADGSPLAEVRPGRPWTTIEWHPGGWVVALAGTNGVEIRDGRTLQVASGECGGAVGPALGFSEDGLFLVTGRKGGGVALWDWAQARLQAVGLPGWDAMERAVLSRDGGRARVESGGRTAVLDLRPGRALLDWNGGTSAVAVATLGAKGRRLFTAIADGSVQLREVAERGKARTVRLASQPSALALSGDGHWLGIALSSGKVRTWSLASGLPTGTWGGHPGVLDVAVSDEGRWLWSRSTNLVRAWMVTDPKVAPVAVVEGQRVHRMTGTAGRWVSLLVEGDGGFEARVYAATNPVTPMVRLPAWDGAVLDVDVGGGWVLTAGERGGLMQRPLGGGEAVRPLIPGPIRLDGARYSRDGQWILGVEPGGRIRIWESASGKVHGARLEVPGVHLDGLDLGPGARRLSLLEVGGVVQVYDVATGRACTEPWWPSVRRARPVRMDVQRFSEDGRVVLVPDGDTGVRLLPLPPEGPAPEWLGGLAEAMWGRGTDPAAELGRLRTRLSDAEGATGWERVGRWLLEDRGTRTTAPGGGWTAVELGGRHLEVGNAGPLVEAFRLAGQNAVVRQALSQQLRTNGFWQRPYRELQAERLGVNGSR